MNRFHHRSALVSVGLLLAAGLAACDSDNTPAGADSGTAPADTGTAPADTGTAPTDTGTTPVDTGVAPTDTGTAPVDAGTAPTDGGGTGMDGAMMMDVPTGPVVSGVVLVNDLPVANATVTVVDRAGATLTTGADGAFSFLLPAGSTQLLRATHATARTIQAMVLVQPTPVTAFNLETIATGDFAGLYAPLGLTEDATKGVLLLHFRDAAMPQPAGFGATLSVTGGTRFVVPEAGPRMQDTTAAGDGTLIIVNLPVGNVTVTPVAPAGHTCTAAYGVTNVRIDARTLTDLSFNCM